MRSWTPCAGRSPTRRSAPGAGGQGAPPLRPVGGQRRWLADAGVRQIEVAGLCTACRVDEFYSYRQEQGKTGHFGAVAVLGER